MSQKNDLPNEFYETIARNNIEEFKHLIKLPEINVNLAIQFAARIGQFEMVHLLMNHKDVNPQDHRNNAIKLANEGCHNEVLLLLWSDQRIKDTLLNDHPRLYNKLIKLDIKSKIINFKK
jgi:hypothetical protein